MVESGATLHPKCGRWGIPPPVEPAAAVGPSSLSLRGCSLLLRAGFRRQRFPPPRPPPPGPCRGRKPRCCPGDRTDRHASRASRKKGDASRGGVSCESDCSLLPTRLLCGAERSEDVSLKGADPAGWIESLRGVASPLDVMAAPFLQTMPVLDAPSERLDPASTGSEQLISSHYRLVQLRVLLTRHTGRKPTWRSGVLSEFRVIRPGYRNELAACRRSWKQVQPDGDDARSAQLRMAGAARDDRCRSCP